MKDVSDLLTCKLCPLATSGKVVIGDGPVPARIMLVGEAPGSEEAQTGRPFVGPSGDRLNILLKLAKLNRADVYITNLVKHQPPANRDPYVLEIKACRVWLEREIAEVDPEIILTLGGLAGRFFDHDLRLDRDHGKSRNIQIAGRARTIYPFYHPAYVFRRADIWGVLVADFQGLASALAERPVVPVGAYELAVDEDLFLTTIGHLDRVGFDFETTSPKKGKYLDLQACRPVGYSVAWSPGRAGYVPGVPKRFAAVLESPLVEKITHSSKFEYTLCKHVGITLTNFHDTKIAAWLMQYHSTHLKALARQLLGRDPITYETVTGGADMADLDPADVFEYAAADADNTRLIWPVLEKELHEAGMWDLYREVELPLVPVLYDMEHTGVNVDAAGAERLLMDMTAVRQTARYDVAKFTPVNIDSTKDLATALEDMGAPITERTAAYDWLKTDAETLYAVRDWNPGLIDTLLDYRRMNTLIGHVTGYITLRGPDGRLHPDFVQAGDLTEAVSDSATGGAPVTGRLSCRAPNLQNVPHHLKGANAEDDTIWTTSIRRLIVPSMGNVFVAGDIGQEEPRIAAFVAPEPTMLRQFESGQPVYGLFAQGIYGRPVDKTADKFEWNVAKKCVLSFIWSTAGGGPWADRLVDMDPRLSHEEALAAYTRLNTMYPGFRLFRQWTNKQLRLHGYVTDYFGRRRWAPKMFSYDGQKVQEALREGVNHQVQGPAATVIKVAMRRVYDSIRRLDLAARLVLSVHDELVVDCPPQEVKFVTSLLLTMTEGIMPIRLPVEVKVGPNWADMEVA